MDAVDRVRDVITKAAMEGRYGVEGLLVTMLGDMGFQFRAFEKFLAAFAAMNDFSARATDETQTCADRGAEL